MTIAWGPVEGRYLETKSTTILGVAVIYSSRSKRHPYLDALFFCPASERTGYVTIKSTSVPQALVGRDSRHIRSGLLKWVCPSCIFSESAGRHAYGKEGGYYSRRTRFYPKLSASVVIVNGVPESLSGSDQVSLMCLPQPSNPPLPPQSNYCRDVLVSSCISSAYASPFSLQ